MPRALFWVAQPKKKKNYNDFSPDFFFSFSNIFLIKFFFISTFLLQSFFSIFFTIISQLSQFSRTIIFNLIAR